VGRRSDTGAVPLVVAQAGAVAGAGIAPKRYLATRAASIYSGTSEIHRNLLARHLLG